MTRRPALRSRCELSLTGPATQAHQQAPPVPARSQAAEATQPKRLELTLPPAAVQAVGLPRSRPHLQPPRARHLRPRPPQRLALHYLDMDAAKTFIL